MNSVWVVVGFTHWKYWRKLNPIKRIIVVRAYSTVKDVEYVLRTQGFMTHVQEVMVEGPIDNG